MKKLIYLIVAIAALSLIVAGCGLLTVPPSEQNELGSIVNKTVVSGEEYTNNIAKEAHKIKNKWNLIGSFEVYDGYNWDGLVPEGATWEYSIHIKEAMDGDCSVGSIRFTSGDIEVIGHVKQTKSNYDYWFEAPYDYHNPNLAATGTAKYNGETYNFQFLFSTRAMWFAISYEGLEPYWTNEDVWLGSVREYQLCSVLNAGIFTLDPKNIH